MRTRGSRIHLHLEVPQRLIRRNHTARYRQCSRRRYVVRTLRKSITKCPVGMNFHSRNRQCLSSQIDGLRIFTTLVRYPPSKPGYLWRLWQDPQSHRDERPCSLEIALVHSYAGRVLKMRGVHRLFTEHHIKQTRRTNDVILLHERAR